MRKKIVKQEQLDTRIEEIRGMSDKQLVWALQAEAGWENLARRDMRIELANNTYEDMELLKQEILRRMSASHKVKYLANDLSKEGGEEK